MCPSHLGLLASTGLGAGFVQGWNSHYFRKSQPHAWALGLLFQSTMDVHSLARGLAYFPRDSGKSVNDRHVPRSHAGVWTHRVCQAKQQRGAPGRARPKAPA